MEADLCDGGREIVSNVRLCAVDDIPDDGSAAFVAEIDDRKIAVMAIRKNGNVFVYENECPHVGAPLDFRPGEFLTDDGENIICSTHAALFRIEDGECIDGPCFGDRLTQINVEVRDGSVYIA
jgi:nitrite reductase/ring-hydroxylating ferredoxin subunit